MYFVSVSQVLSNDRPARTVPPQPPPASKFSRTEHQQLLLQRSQHGHGRCWSRQVKNFRKLHLIIGVKKLILEEVLHKSYINYVYQDPPHSSPGIPIRSQAGSRDNIAPGFAISVTITPVVTYW